MKGFPSLTGLFKALERPAELGMPLARSNHEMLENVCWIGIIESRRSFSARQALETFQQEWQSRSIEAIQEKLTTVSMRDGDLDRNCSRGAQMS